MSNSANTTATTLGPAVAKQLRAERAAQGWSYRELASAAGMTEQTVMRYRTEKRDIRLSDLGSLADAFNIRPDTLVSRAMERMQAE